MNLLIFIFALFCEGLWEDVPDPDFDIFVCVEVEIFGPIQALVLRPIEVYMFRPFHWKICVYLKTAKIKSL